MLLATHRLGRSASERAVDFYLNHLALDDLCFLLDPYTNRLTERLGVVCMMRPGVQ